MRLPLSITLALVTIAALITTVGACDQQTTNDVTVSQIDYGKDPDTDVCFGHLNEIDLMFYAECSRPIQDAIDSRSQILKHIVANLVYVKDHERNVCFAHLEDAGFSVPCSERVMRRVVNPLTQ